MANENLTHGLLIRFLENVTGLTSRDAPRVLLHPSFDRGTLLEMLNLEQNRLVRSMLGHAMRFKLREFGPVAPQYLLPGELIRHIYNLPSSGRFDQQIAANFNTPADILVKLAARGDPGLDLVLMSNPGLPAEALRSLAQRRSHERGRAQLANNPGAPADILLEIAGSGQHVRALLENPATPGNALETLYLRLSSAQDQFQSREKIKSLLKHNNITPTLMDRVLTEMEEGDLVLLAARNPVTVSAVLEKIARREYAIFTSRNSDQFAKEIDRELAANPATPWEIKRKLLRY